MQMNNDEIVVRYRQAKKKGEQVQILAELNGCPVEKIIGILTANGFDSRNFNQLRAKLKNQEKHKPEPPVEDNSKIIRQEAEQLANELKENYEKQEAIKAETIEKIPYKKPEIIQAPKPITIATAIAALHERVAELNAQKKVINDELAEISEALALVDNAIKGRDEFGIVI